MANIEEVAREAGVSVATVSRVLNKSNAVAVNTRIKVETIIKKLNYEPNMLGRNLRRSESRMILALMPNMSNPFYTKIVHGIEDVARKSGYSVLLCQTDLNLEREKIYINLLKQKLADGLISMDPTLDKGTLKDVGVKYPIIQCCEYSEEVNIPYITIDNYNAGYKAVKHLLSIGRKRIALINSDNKFQYARLRQQGYKKAIEEAGLEYKEEYVINGELDFESGQRAMKQLLSLEIKPDAVFLVSDVLAIGALKSLKEARVSVPEDIAIVGFDNIQFATMTNPSITTIAQPMYEIGCQSCKMLIEKIKNKEAKIDNIVMDFELIIRESTMR